mmetsp:Transcript_450/g.1323  ORF Transcript_450/g.1323 Transcript_450/m.1323 type:complete len:388 (+) Transcript_450:46-1209(+)
MAPKRRSEDAATADLTARRRAAIGLGAGTAHDAAEWALHAPPHPDCVREAADADRPRTTERGEEQDGGEQLEGLEELEEAEQSLAEFRAMGKVGRANEDGTGRWVPGPAFNEIAVLPLFSGVISAARGRKIAAQTQGFLGAFFTGMSVKIMASQLRLREERGGRKRPSWSIIDAEQGLLFPLATLGKADGPAGVDVFAIMNVVEEYLHKPTFSIVVLTDVPIIDPEAPESTILGRATGDRVAVIGCADGATELRLRSILGTAAHEALHCLGLDHCSLWSCLMNAYSPSEEEREADGGSSTPGHRAVLSLCPLDLLKLEMATGTIRLRRFEALQAECTKLGFHHDANWFARRASVCSLPRSSSLDESVAKRPKRARAERARKSAKSRE